MFGTMGFSELIIILVIVLIIFGAGKLPQIGEGVGKALKGFKKEVHEAPQLPDANDQPEAATAAPSQAAQTQPSSAESQAAPDQAKPTNVPYQPGPELTPGTTASKMYEAGPTPYQPHQPTPPPAAPTPSTSPATPPPAHAQAPPTMEERMGAPAPAARASYPSLPPNAQPKPGAKRPSAIVNKDAVARVQAQQAAKRQAAQGKGGQGGMSPQDMQSLGEGLGDALRTFRQAATDVRGAIEPEVRTIQTEMDSAQKEIEQTVESARQMPAVHEDPPRST